jgi:hypothetical protein
MSQVNDFGAIVLKKSSDNVDAGIVAVEEAGGRDKANRSLIRQTYSPLKTGDLFSMNALNPSF